LNLIDVVKHYARKVDDFIFRLLSVKPDIDFLYRACRHLLEAGGKRLRPFLVIQSCMAVGGSEESAIPFAAAVELVHNFTLIHDDIMDQDSFRRGVPTVHVLWGVPTAILAGDLLFSKAFEAIFHNTATTHIPPHVVLRISRKLAETVSTIAEGQALDMKFSGALKEREVSEEDYFKVIAKKTAALFEASCEIGGLAGCGTNEQVHALSKYGYNIGLAFQMQDDILGVIADEKVLGKPVGSDLREGKCTLILIHALRNARDADRRFIMDIYGKKNFSRSDYEKFLEIIRKLGSIDYVLKVAKNYVEKAKKSLEVLPESNARDLLMNLADFIVSRKY